MSESDEQIKLERNPDTGINELVGINGEVELSSRIVDAVAMDKSLIDFVVLHIAHNRAEQGIPERGMAIGQVVAHEVAVVHSEMLERLQSGV